MILMLSIILHFYYACFSVFHHDLHQNSAPTVVGSMLANYHVLILGPCVSEGRRTANRSKLGQALDAMKAVGERSDGNFRSDFSFLSAHHIPPLTP